MFDRFQYTRLIGTPLSQLDSKGRARNPTEADQFLHRAEVPDDAAGVNVDDVFGDVSAVVGDALEVLGDHDVAKLGVGLLAVGFHEADHVLDDLVIESVHDVVALDDVAGEVLVAQIERLDGVAEGGHDGVGHELQVAGGLVIGQLGKGQDALGDVDGAIGDAFEVGVDFDDGGDDAQIAGGGLLKGQEVDRALLDADFLVVDALIEGDGFLSELGIGGEDGIASLLDNLKDQSRHARHLRSQVFKKIGQMM